MAAPPTTQPPTLDDQELRMIQIVLKSRGWSITDAHMTDHEIILIATRPRGPVTLTAAQLRDLE